MAKEFAVHPAAAGACADTSTLAETATSNVDTIIVLVVLRHQKEVVLKPITCESKRASSVYIASLSASWRNSNIIQVINDRIAVYAAQLPNAAPEQPHLLEETGEWYRRIGY
jgi:hypothetical protein